jgi:AcrR family transcriptional regulator
MARTSKESKHLARQKLIETAARHFAEHGVGGARVDAISNDAGFAKGTLYNYFPSKNDLFAAVIEEACHQALRAYESAEMRATVRDRLRALAAADVAVLRENEGFVQVLVREAMSFRPETYPLIVEHLAPLVAKVVEVLEAGVNEGTIRDDRPPPQLALLFIGLLSLTYIQHWGSGGTWPALDDVPDLVVTTFLDGAGGRNE